MANYVVTRANVVLAIALTGFILFGAVTFDRFRAAKSATLLLQQSYEVLQAIKELNLAAHDAETGQRGYLLTGRDDYLAPYLAAFGRITFLQGDLQRLTADNPAQQKRLRALAPVLRRQLEILAQAVELRRAEGFEAALALVSTNLGRELTKNIESTLAAMTADEQDLLVHRQASADDHEALVVCLALAGGGVAILALLWAARTLNFAWSRSQQAEREHRDLAVQLRTSFDSLSQGIAVFSADGKLVNWNGCFQVLLGLPKALMREGMPYAAFQEHSAEGGGLLESEAELRACPRRPGEPAAYEGTRPGGHRLERRRTSMPDGGVVLTITDMTKRAQAEAILRETQKMQAIGQLTGGIAHDFNNLLTIILGNLEFVLAKPEDEQKMRLRVERATWAAQRGAALTRQLLAFARKQPLEPAAIDLRTALPDLVPLLRRTLGEHIDVRYLEPDGLWLALADLAQLENAVLNLALNARDAMPEGGRLTIELANTVLDESYASQHAEVSPGDYTMLAVSDTGHGMPPEILARVFEPFFTTKPEGQGTGLGLAMVFGFVKQSGGHVKIHSEPGEGTTVRLFLPRAAGAAAAGPRGREAAADLPRGSATILIVEDEPAVREIAAALLSDLGYRVLQAADGEEALRMFGAHASGVQLLLTDLVLPGRMRGAELAERVTAIRPATKILFMSGYAMSAAGQPGGPEDGGALITKPFQRDQLARKVFEALGETAPQTFEDATKVVALKQRRGEQLAYPQ